MISGLVYQTPGHPMVKKTVSQPMNNEKRTVLLIISTLNGFPYLFGCLFTGLFVIFVRFCCLPTVIFGKKERN